MTALPPPMPMSDDEEMADESSSSDVSGNLSPAGGRLAPSTSRPSTSRRDPSPRTKLSNRVRVQDGIDNDDIALVDDNDNTEAPSSSKRAKSSAKPRPPSSSSLPPGTKCKNCRQRLDGIRIRPKYPQSSMSEEKALQHPRIRVEGSTEEDLQQALITKFVLHDRDGHLVNLTWGLIEEGKTVYFSGYIKGVFDGKPHSTDNGVPVIMGGPVQEFWSTGFEAGEQPVIGITTKQADYYLKEPHNTYKPLIQELTERTALSKLVIEVIKEAMMHSSDLTYDDGLERVADRAQSVGIDMFSEEVLLRHAEAIINQINSYEEAEDVEVQEIVLIQSSFVQELMEYAGVVLKPHAITNKEDTTDRRKSAMSKDSDYSPSEDEDPEDRDYKASQQGRYKSKTKESSARLPALSKATTTPLVRYVFDKVFKNQIAEKDAKRTRDSGLGPSSHEKACGICKNCLKQDCGSCAVCKEKAIFGGKGRGANQTCLVRACLAVDIMEVPVAGDEQIQSSLESLKDDTRVEFLGEPVKVDQWNKRAFYEAVRVQDTRYELGDCVMIRPDISGTACFIGKILYFLKEGREKIAHVRYFCHSGDTVLGELGDRKELFALDDCEDVELFELQHKVSVTYQPVPENWSRLGGSEEAVVSPSVSEDQFSYWFRMKYEPRHARFTKVDYNAEFSTEYDPDRNGQCRLCALLDARSFEQVPKPRLLVANAGYSDDSTTKEYKSFVLHGETFFAGDAAYLTPSAFSMPYEMRKESSNIPKNQVRMDPIQYPEYQKHTGNIRGSNELTPEPFRIVVIERIAQKSGSSVMICVRKMYRPENTLQGDKESLTLHSDINLIFWSDDLACVPATLVEGKCFIRPSQVLDMDPSKWHEEGLHRFYFQKKYCSGTHTFEEVHRSIIQQYSDKNRYPTLEGGFPDVKQTLATLDVFAGCGGLSLGLEKSGISNSKWAIENFAPAAKAFELNHPECSVINVDCNKVLQEVMDGRQALGDGTVLPQKGEVELLCGGPPCQGFSSMNNFSEREYSQFKNSLISSYLSYCDYYRPKYFILENVMNFASYKSNLVLKLCLRALNMMGYQCTFGILQAGSFGVPQTRRRTILLAAAPDQVLPRYPEPRHVFDKKAMKLNVVVDKKNFATDARWNNQSAPYRTITIRDAMDDLPEVKIGASREELKYKMAPRSHFQRMVRREHGSVLFDHITKKFSPLIAERIRRIPFEPGSDWRDLPNIVCKLSDGTSTEKLYYSYREPGRQVKNAVCCCQTAKGKKCDPSDRQINTLIPWALNHTGARNNNWAGLYGRVSWDGFFSTTVTNPEPMSKQGRVLHPQQHRVVSVRECARSQGFPDWFRFVGTLMDKHRQIGNAVPPPMGMAIGHEIRKAVAQSQCLA